jgi:UDP-N-acetylmuramate: L-alanyl-gamma-D-glutamyl-meso-diaminopimelate ligase
MDILDPQLNKAPEQVRHIHLMGICGTGMAALAGMLQSSGYTITGSDNHVYPPMSLFLEKLKIKVCEGYSGDNLDPAPDMVIVGNVITRKNPEAIALGEKKISYLSFPQALSHFFIASRSSLVVAGTHGKTTTCSLLATALYKANLDPTFMIGGIVREFDANFRLGSGPYFVAEGDEYDTAFFDKGSKFLHYRPKIAILTSIEFDHADIFQDLEAIKRSFSRFVGLIPEDGLLVANLDDPNIVEVIQNAKCEVQSYGLQSDRMWSFHEIHHQNGLTTFTILKNGEPWAKVSLKMAGRHNSLNCLAVCAVLDRLQVPAEKIKDLFEDFGGVKKRQEVRGIVNGITVIDDFAHHPTAVRETLAALANAYAGHRLVVIFEPRTNSSRRAVFQQDYVLAFDQADIVIVREPMPIDGLKTDELFSAARLADDLRNKRNIDATAFPTTDQILNRLEQILQPNDVVTILSNGGFDNIHERLLLQLRQQGC